ncbi:MAG TPA: hypothetical protein VFE63_10675 [Roseiarcus sp.]|nr:hypothetical protein [Roseiarcus sp.]
MRPAVHVVYQKNIDALEAEPDDRLLDRAHDPVVAVVEHRTQLERSGPMQLVDRLAARGGHIASDLG